LTESAWPVRILGKMPRAASLRAVRARTTSASMWAVRWARWFAVVALVFAMPATQQVVEHVAALVVADSGDACADDCDCRDCCPGACAHCVNCAAPIALPSSPVGELAGVPPAVARASEGREGRPASGYGLPPFRPPTA
jgi:hypothetical protein